MLLKLKEQALSSDGEMRSRLQERVEEADITLTLQKTAGKTPKWAEANIERAEALIALAAEEEGGDAFSCYDQAIVAYEGALEVYTREDYLGEWGGVIVSLVRALRTYAAREGGRIGLLRLDRGKKLLDEVAAAMPEGLGQFDCAMLMIEQAHICRVRCDIDRSSERRHHLQDALSCFEEAAQILRIKENFDNWATAIVGQAMVWREIATLEMPQSPLDFESQSHETNYDKMLSALLRCVELFKAASSYYTPVRHLEDFIFCHFELGRSLLRLARSTTGKPCQQAASEAVVSFKKALEHIKEEYTPELWMRCHIDMAFSLIKLESFATRDELAVLIREEVAIFRMATDHYRTQADVVTFCVMASSFGQKLLQLADFKRGEEAQRLCIQALEALRQSADDGLKNLSPDDWLSHTVDLGIVLHNVAVAQQGRMRRELGEEAIGAYQRALEYIETQHDTEACALLRNRLGRLLTILGEEDDSQDGVSRLEEAHACFCQTRDYYDVIMQRLNPATAQDERGNKIIFDLIRFRNNFATVLYILAERADGDKAQNYLKEAFILLSQIMPLVKMRSGTSQWHETHALYGRIFKYRLQRGFVRDEIDACDAAAAILRQALEQLDKQDAQIDDKGHWDEEQEDASKMSRLILFRHLADILCIWGEKLPKVMARPLFEEAHDLMSHLRDWAEKCGFEDIVLSSGEELVKIEMMQDSCRRGWMFQRFWLWLRSLYMRLV